MAEYFDKDKDNDVEKNVSNDCLLYLYQRVWHKYGAGDGGRFQLFYVSAIV